MAAPRRRTDCHALDARSLGIRLAAYGFVAGGIAAVAFRLLPPNV